MSSPCDAISAAARLYDFWLPGILVFMTKDAGELKKLAMVWKRATPALRKARREGIRRQSNYLAIDALNSLFRQAIRQIRPRRSSGLVEMYKVFGRQKNG